MPACILKVSTARSSSSAGWVTQKCWAWWGRWEETPWWWMLEEKLSSLDFSQPMEIFSQTTKSPTEYEEICNLLFSRGARLIVHNTICAQVASRHEKLAAFASSHDVILFVSGKSSSNGKVLSDLCRSANSRTHLVGSAAELDPSWFREGESVGVCGATSTPKWLLEQVADAVSALK